MQNRSTIVENLLKFEGFFNLSKRAGGDDGDGDDGMDNTERQWPKIKDNRKGTTGKRGVGGGGTTGDTKQLRESLN